MESVNIPARNIGIHRSEVWGSAIRVHADSPRSEGRRGGNQTRRTRANFENRDRIAGVRAKSTGLFSDGQIRARSRAVEAGCNAVVFKRDGDIAARFVEVKRHG